MSDPAEHFDDFWRASELGPLTVGRFAERLGRFDPAPPAVHPWQRTGPAHPLGHPRGRLTSLLRRRRSDRDLGARPLRHGDLSALLGALARTDSGWGHPSAGDLRAVRASVILWRTDHPLAGRVAQHDPERHTLTDVGPAPDWQAEQQALGGLDTTTPPAAAVVLLGDPTAVVEKYGERGGRFLLLEAGSALQSLSLAAAERRLPAYATGGAFDSRLRAVCGHARTGALPLAVLLLGGR